MEAEHSYDVIFRLWHHGGEIEFIGKDIFPPISTFLRVFHRPTRPHDELAERQIKKKKNKKKKHLV